MTQAAGRGGQGQEQLTTGPIFENCKNGVLKFDHSAVQGESYWKAMKGDKEKERTFSNSVHHFKRGGLKD